MPKDKDTPIQARDIYTYVECIVAAVLANAIMGSSRDMQTPATATVKYKEMVQALRASGGFVN
jgi:hypothetical protein